MAGVALVNPKYSFTDALGVPLVGGTLDVYLAGSTTRTNTWQDKAQTTLNTNPIVLDSRGECTLWADDTLTYKFVLKNSSGVQQWSVDNISGATVSATLVNFTQAGTGAVTRTAQNKMRDIISVTDFYANGTSGAAVDPSGVVDSTAGIQAAITYANSLGGATVFFPAGSYKITSTLLMKKWVTLQGSGKKATQINYNGTGNAIEMISPLNASTGVFTVARDFSINMTNAANTGGGYVDVGGTFVELTNVGVYGGLYGLIFDQTELADCDLCEFTAQLAGGAGAWLANGTYTVGANTAFTNRISFTRCQFNQNNTTHCIADDGGYVHKYTGNNFNGGLSHLRVTAAETMVFSDNECEVSAGACVQFKGTALNGSVLSGSSVHTVTGNILVPQAGQPCITVSDVSIGYLILDKNSFVSTGATAMVTGGSLIATLIDLGNFVTGSPFLSGTPTVLSRVADVGTWTPSIKIGGSAPASQTVTTGSYSRVGNVITCSMDVSLTTKGGLTGSVTITGLPYAAKTGTLQFLPPPFSTGLVVSTSVGAVLSASTIALQNSNWNFSATLTDANISATTRFAMTFSYIAD